MPMLATKLGALAAMRAADDARRRVELGCNGPVRTAEWAPPAA